MTHVDSTERAALIRGFRGLADYLESDPEVPAPSYSTVYTFPPDSDWTACEPKSTPLPRCSE
jgi:hypothetical protein